MRRLLVLLVCLLGLATIAHARTLSPREFAQEFAKALATALPSATLVFKGDLELSVKLPDGKEATAYLDNAYKTYSRDPSELEQVIRMYVSSLVESQKMAGEIDRTRIVPVIKDRSWLVEVQRTARARGAEIPETVFEDFNSELVVIYAEDSPKGIRYFVRKDLEKAGIERTGLRTLAIENLKRLIPKIEVRRAPLMTMITAGGDYEASLLLFDDIWSSGRLEVDGDIVVAVPSRDLLLVTGSRNPAGLAKLREAAAKFAKESVYSLTDALFIYKNGRFTKLEAK